VRVSGRWGVWSNLGGRVLERTARVIQIGLKNPPRVTPKGRSYSIVS
jgi:hypothetical protein